MTKIETLVAEIEGSFDSLRPHLNGEVPGRRGQVVRKYREALSDVIEEMKGLEDEIGRTRQLVSDFPSFEKAVESLRGQLTGAAIQPGLMNKIQDIGGSAIVGLDMGKEEALGEFLNKMVGIQNNAPTIPSQNKIDALFKQNVTDPSKAVTRKLDNKLEALRDRFSQLPDQISGIVEVVVVRISDELGEKIEELEGSVKEKIELGTELSGILDDELSSVVTEVGDAVSEIEGTFEELSEVWESANDDLPESGGALQDAINGFEAAQEAIENVYE